MIDKLKSAISHSILLSLVVAPYLINATQNSSFILPFLWLILGVVFFDFVYQKLSGLILHQFGFDIKILILPPLLIVFYYDPFIYFVHAINNQSIQLHSLKARHFIPVIWLLLVIFYYQIRPKLNGRFIILNSFLFIYSCSILITHFLEGQSQEEGKSHFISMKSDKSKPVILLILDEYASPEELYKNKADSSLFNFNHTLIASGWQVHSNQYSYNLKTANSLSSLFNYNYQSKDSELNVNESIKSLKESKLILDLQKKGIKIYNYGIFDIGDSKAYTKIYFYEEEGFKTHFLKQLFANSMLRLLYESHSKQIAHNQFLIEKGVENIKSLANTPSFIHVHLLMPHMPYEYKGPKNYSAISNINSVENYISYWNFTNSLIQDSFLNPLVRSAKFKVIITGDHGYRWNKDQVNPHLTMTAYYGFPKRQLDQVKSVQDLGSLIYASY
jgi:hypothetical protein